MPTLPDLEIREGDTLIIDGRSYPVKVCETYKAKMLMIGFRRMARELATVTRWTPTGGGEYASTVVAENVRCTPLDPLTNDRREVLQTPEKMLQTFIATPAGFYKLTLEDLKK